MKSVCIAHAIDADSLEGARLLMRRYADFLAGMGIDLCFQNFEQELAELPGPYRHPDGVICLARTDQQVLGVVAVKPLPEPGLCEMKRLWVEPSAQGLGLGRKLVENAIEFARHKGYAAMRLDTLAERMPAAVALYWQLGKVCRSVTSGRRARRAARSDQDISKR